MILSSHFVRDLGREVFYYLSSSLFFYESKIGVQSNGF